MSFMFREMCVPINNIKKACTTYFQRIKSSNRSTSSDKEKRNNSHNLPSSIVEATEEDRERLQYTLLLMALEDYNFA